jgi:hypothetical protein
MPRYKNSVNQALYDKMIVLAADKTSELYHQGKPRRGAGHRSAFWDGYRGDAKSAMVIPGTLSAVCYQAGRQFAKTNPGIKDTEFYLTRMWA